eukprot:TRINITY_DN2267_c0_g1_i4.p1 TRINITY_DN2267_c0_g1~~TRINITY_DN2267_c0_g1_i4.p1  ORF type:complete len:786 (-),score=365.17 TRINITY_DN2267_c0_g1_i4:133-2349(-)
MEIAVSNDKSISFKAGTAGSITFGSLLSKLGGSASGVFGQAIDGAFKGLGDPKMVIKEFYISTERENLGMRMVGDLQAGSKKLGFDFVFSKTGNVVVIYFTVPQEQVQPVLTKALSFSKPTQTLGSILKAQSIDVWYASGSLPSGFLSFSKKVETGFGFSGAIEFDNAAARQNMQGLAAAIFSRVTGKFEVKVALSATKASFSVKLPDIIIKESDADPKALSLIGPTAEISAQFSTAALSFSIDTGLAWSSGLQVKGKLTLDSTGSGTVALEQSGVITNPMRIPNSKLLGMSGSLKVNPAPPYIMGGSFGTTFQIGEDQASLGVKAILTTVAFSLDAANPTSNWIYGSISTLRIGDLIYQFGFNDATKFSALSPALRGSGLSQVAFSSSASAQKIKYTDPNTNKAQTIDVFAGVMFQGQLDLVGWTGSAKVAVNVDAPYISIKYNSNPVRVANVAEFTLSAGQTNEGPKVDLDAGRISGVPALSGSIEGYLNVLGLFATQTKFRAATDGIQADISASLWNLFAVQVAVKADWSSLANLGLDVSASFAIGPDSELGRQLAQSVGQTNKAIDAQPESDTCSLLEVGSAESDVAWIDTQFQHMLDEAHALAAATGQDSHELFQDRVDDWLEERRALLEQDSELETTGVCKEQKKSWKLRLAKLAKFSLQVSFKGRIGAGWFAEVSYRLTHGDEAIDGSLRLDMNTVNAAKQLMEAAWQKLKEYVKAKEKGIAKFFREKLFN